MNLRRPLVAGACVLTLSVVACTPTARTPGPYAAKAKKTAQAVHSAVASDLLLIEATRRGHTTAAFVSSATSQAEDEGSEAASTFLGIQPPDENSEQLRDQLSQLLDDAQDALGDARIAGRRGDNDALFESFDKLAQVDDQLQQAMDGDLFSPNAPASTR